MSFHFDHLILFLAQQCPINMCRILGHSGGRCRMARLNKQLMTILAAFCLKADPNKKTWEVKSLKCRNVTSECVECHQMSPATCLQLSYGSRDFDHFGEQGTVDRYPQWWDRDRWPFDVCCSSWFPRQFDQKPVNQCQKGQLRASSVVLRNLAAGLNSGSIKYCIWWYDYVALKENIM